MRLGCFPACNPPAHPNTPFAFDLPGTYVCAHAYTPKAILRALKAGVR